MKRQLALILSFVMIWTILASGAALAAVAITQKDIDEGLYTCAQYPVKVNVDNKALTFGAKEVPPVIIKGSTLVPARAVAEAMGGTVGWEEAKGIVTVELNGIKVELIINSNTAYVNGVQKELAIPAMIIDHDKDYFGSTMIPLRFVSEALNGIVGWDDSSRLISITSRNIETSNPVVPKPEETTSGGIITTTKEAITFTPEDIAYIDTAYIEAKYGKLDKLTAMAANKIIVIDSGHGGNDSGSIGHKNQWDELYEKNVNLPAAQRLANLLKSAGATVYMTHAIDKTMSLYDRPAFANYMKADLFISIHNNSSELTTPKGTEVHYYSKTYEAGKTEKDVYGIVSKDLASKVQKEMIAIMGTQNRGIKESPKLAVLNKTSMPAIIVEGAFLSNDSDLSLMKSDEYKDKYAYAVAKATIEYLNSMFK